MPLALVGGPSEIGSLPLSFRIRHSEILLHSLFIGYLFCHTLPPSCNCTPMEDGGPPEAKLPSSPDIPLLYPGNTISPVKLEAATLLDLTISRGWMICEAYCCFSFSRRRMLWLTFRPGRTQVLSLSPARPYLPRQCRSVGCRRYSKCRMLLHP